MKEIKEETKKKHRKVEERKSLIQRKKIWLLKVSRNISIRIKQRTDPAKNKK